MGIKPDDNFDYATIHPHFESMGWNEAPTLESNDAPCGELVMWRRVVTTAISDFCRTGETAREQFLRQHAQHWLLENRSHFYTVCALADVDADRLRLMMREFLTLPDEARKRLKLQVTKL